MRADNDHAVENSIESCKDGPKPQQCPEEYCEDAELKILENGKNNNNMCELFYDTRNGDDGNITEHHSCGDSNVVGKKIDPVFFMDKNVTVCDTPEIVVCYKENTYNVVKDICVDEGVPLQEKFLFGENDLMKADRTNVNSLETKSLEDSNGKVDDSDICKTGRDIEDFADAEGSSNRNQEGLIVMEEFMEFPSHSLNPFEASLEIESEETSKVEDIANESLTLGDILLREDEQKPPLIQEKEKRSLETTCIETEDLEKTEEAEKTEEKHSSVLTTTPQEPNKTCNDLEKLQTENHQQSFLVLDSYDDDKVLTSGFGETSFSAAEQVSISGHITYSGPITISGSLSVRSDASTTSGRSFAFPILQSEWNSSPVRMAKADKRRQKGWRHSLLCCRFS